MRNLSGKTLVPGLMLVLLSVVCYSFWSAGCAPNDPFDPDSLENQRPIASIFVSHGTGEEELNPTSYFNRTFEWSGTDRDGWVEMFFVSILTDPDSPAVWDTTTATDTTMTFLPDPSTGEASATFLIVCRDNRGALSDTVRQFIPMRNHPPTLTFKPDFEPLKNLQREFVFDGEAIVDTNYYNWGANNFRFNVYDLDGSDTMDSFFRYTLVEGGNPDIEFDLDDPDADPEVGWVKSYLGTGSESYDFDIYIPRAEPGLRTLTVSVKDQAQGDPNFQYSWEVRAPKSSVLYIPDNSSSVGRGVYNSLLDNMFGQGNWDQYDFVFGFPDKPYVLLENMRQFDVVLWTDGGTMSSVMATASVRDGALHQYVQPLDEDTDAGRLLLVSKTVAGSGVDGPSPVFISSVFGINASAGSPEGILQNFGGRQAESQGAAAYLPNMTGLPGIAQGTGLDLSSGGEELYRMELCVRCYGPPAPPFDPVVGSRMPPRAENPLASAICFSIQLEYFNNSQVITALEEVLVNEMGVVTP
ncbi:MAG: hypothetical protein GY780_05255 [bacterium]|nr:hypothetical protein [bacterium]